VKQNQPVRILEWFLLLFGLAAIDSYIWIQAKSVIYEAYDTWSFDASMRGVKPTLTGFLADEFHGLFGRDRLENADVPTIKTEPLPAEKPPLPQSLIGRLRIPRLNVVAMVREGADSATLSHAVGHIPGTALPGKAGNVALAGHRDTIFRALRSIKQSDSIDLETDKGTFRYIVASTQIVNPKDVSVLAAGGGPTLTLVTCYPFYYVGSAPKRFIVRANQEGTAANNASAKGWVASGPDDRLLSSALYPNRQATKNEGLSHVRRKFWTPR
jgi:sortase A